MDSRKRKRSNFDKEKSVVAGDISVLSEDLIHEILIRLPPSSLLNSISASRFLLRVSGSPLFRRHYKSRRPSSLLGFFVNQIVGRTSYIPISTSSTAVSEPHSACIIDSLGGWLLLKNFNNSSLRLFHPIFKETIVDIVQPPINRGSSYFYALLPDPFSFNPRCRIRILRVLTTRSCCPLIQIFSSETPGEWKWINSFGEIHIGRCFVSVHPVLVNGFVHWLKGDRQILVFNENSHDLSLLALPRGIPRGLPRRFINHSLGNFNDQLCYAYLEESELYIWVLVDRLQAEWHLERRFEVGKFPELDSHSNQTRFYGIGIGGSLNAIFQGSMGKIFSLGLASGELREIGKADYYINDVFPCNHLI